MTPQLQHLFYIDDDVDILAIVKFTCERMGGLSVTTRSDSKAALKELATITPDLIMVDVMMPDIDGPSVISQARTMPHLQSIPIIITTASVQRSDIERYKTLDVAGVLQKPFHPLTLIETIRDFWLHYHNNKIDDGLDIPDDLKTEYLATLNLYHKQMGGFLQQYQHHLENRTDLEQIAALAHKLIGSGKTYGYPAISDHANQLKNAIHENIDREMIQSTTTLLLDCIEETLQS